MGGDLNEALGGIKYLNVRRLINFLRESIDEGTQFAVFEPNSPPLWQRIIRSVDGFLTGVWRDGALFGDVPEQAFRVICDETTNPPDVRARGQVVTEIWVAPVKPAEFVIFRINQVNEIPA
jgi:phage tail sheath protein FI